MTASTTRGTELDIDNIVHRAYQLSGLKSAQQGESGQGWTVQASLGRLYLDTILDELQVDGIYSRSVIFRDLTLTASTYRYTLGTDVLDIVGDAMYIDPDETDLTKASGETVISQISREQWHALSSKDSEGTPTQYFVHRAPSLQIWFHPIPEEAGTVRMQVHRLSSDTYDGTATLELRQYWTQYLMWELAHHLSFASGLSKDRWGHCRSEANRLRKRARAYANQHRNVQMVVDHKTPTYRSYR